MLVVDSGSLLFSSQRVLEAQREQAIAQAELIVAAKNETGAAALNIGDRDLAAGRKALQDLAKRARFPFLSANLLDPSTERPIFRPFVVAEAGGRRIGFVGLLSPRSLPPVDADGQAEFKIGDPAEAAKAAVRELKKRRVHAIVLLSQLLEEEVVEVIEAAPEIGMILGSQRASRMRTLGELAGRPHATSQMRGQFLGLVSLYLQPGGLEIVERARGRSLVEAIQQLDRRIRVQERQWERFANRPDVQQRRLDFFERSIERQIAERKELVAELEQVAPANPAASFLEFELVSLGAHLEDDPTVQDMIDEFKNRRSSARIQTPPAVRTRPVGLKPSDQAPLKRLRHVPRPPTDNPSPAAPSDCGCSSHASPPAPRVTR